MWTSLQQALRLTGLLYVCCGLLYPMLLTGLAQLLLPEQAGGSLLHAESGAVIGARNVGQPFEHPAYFHGRPSMSHYDGMASGGSSWGPTSRALRTEGQARLAKLAGQPNEQGPVPVELVTASASGLDPHLSPEAARWQLTRVAAARQLSPARLESILEARVEGRTWGLLGEPRVNVLALNLALDRLLGPAPSLAPTGAVSDEKVPTNGFAEKAETKKAETNQAGTKKAETEKAETNQAGTEKAETEKAETKSAAPSASGP